MAKYDIIVNGKVVKTIDRSNATQASDYADEMYDNATVRLAKDTTSKPAVAKPAVAKPAPVEESSWMPKGLSSVLSDVKSIASGGKASKAIDFMSYPQRFVAGLAMNAPTIANDAYQTGRALIGGIQDDQIGGKDWESGWDAVRNYMNSPEKYGAIEQMATDPTLFAPIPKIGMIKQVNNPWVRKGLQGMFEGVEQGALQTGVEAAQGKDVNANNMIIGGIGGGVINPLGTKVGQMLQKSGKDAIEKAVKVPENISNFAANAPDVENLVNLNGENIVPYFGGLNKLSERVRQKIDVANASNPELVETMGSKPIYNLDLLSQINSYKESLAPLLASGKLTPEQYATRLDIANREMGIVQDQMLARKGDVGTVVLDKPGDLEPIPGTEYLQNLPPKTSEELKARLAERRGLGRSISTESVPFDIGYEARKRFDDNSTWDKTFNPQRNVEEEEAYRLMRTPLTSAIDEITGPGNMAAIIEERIRSKKLLPTLERNFLRGIYIPTPEQLQRVGLQPTATPTATEFIAAVKSTAKDLARKRVSSFEANQDIYRRLLPWSDPLLRASTKETRNNMFGLPAIMSMGAGLAGGSLATAGAGLAGAGLLSALRGPGMGSAIYDIGRRVETDPFTKYLVRLLNETGDEL